MKHKNYRLSQKAKEDLETIWLYTYQRWSAKQADHYFKLIVDEIEYIAENSESGRSIDIIKKGYRSSIVKSHMLIYRKNKGGVVEIIRILHQRMDIENRL